MIYTIPKGKHRARPFRFRIWYGRSHFKFRVMFLPTCRYDLQSEDQEDINKLIGVGFVPWWKMLFVIAPLKFLGLLSNQHHKESARYGWNYNKTTDRIQVFSYCYVEGEKKWQLIYECEIGQHYDLELYISNTAYFFQMEPYRKMGKTVDHKVNHYHRYKWMFRLGPYFGGNRAAVHKTQIEIIEL